MSSPASQSEAAPAADFTRTWRYKIGLGLIIIGHLVLAMGLVLPALGLAGGVLVGVLLASGEIISLSSIVFLGVEGFKAIKSKVFAFAKVGYAASVGPVRHYIGIVLLCTNVLTTYITVLYAWAAFKATTPESPTPVIWGLEFAQQETLVFWLFLIGEVSFLVAIYVLGADWWGKFRRIFVWEAPAD